MLSPDGRCCLLVGWLGVRMLNAFNGQCAPTLVRPLLRSQTGILRFWIHAFSCKSKQQGVQLATHMISCCTRVRNMYRARRAQGQGRMKMSKDGNAELPAGAAPQFNDTMVGDSSVMVRHWLGRSGAGGGYSTGTAAWPFRRVRRALVIQLGTRTDAFSSLRVVVSASRLWLTCALAPVDSVAHAFRCLQVDNQECDDINLTLALDAATSMLGGQDQSMSGDFQNMTVNEDDYGLISDALDEMYDLDCTLQSKPHSVRSYPPPLSTAAVHRRCPLNCRNVAFRSGGGVDRPCACPRPRPRPRPRPNPSAVLPVYCGMHPRRGFSFSYVDLFLFVDHLLVCPCPSLPPARFVRHAHAHAAGSHALVVPPPV